MQQRLKIYCNSNSERFALVGKDYILNTKYSLIARY